MVHEVNINKDELLWEDLITIQPVEGNLSSHIVRIYQTKDKEKYYLFIQLDSEKSFPYDENVINTRFTSWGKIIMNYCSSDYEELKKVIKINDDIPIYQISGNMKQIANNTFESPQIIPFSYRK